MIQTQIAIPHWTVLLKVNFELNFENNMSNICSKVTR